MDLPEWPFDLFANIILTQEVEICFALHLLSSVWWKGGLVNKVTFELILCSSCHILKQQWSSLKRETDVLVDWDSSQQDGTSLVLAWKPSRSWLYLLFSILKHFPQIVQEMSSLLLLFISYPKLLDKSTTYLRVNNVLQYIQKYNE